MLININKNISKSISNISKYSISNTTNSSNILADQLLKNSRIALSKSITLVESTRIDHQNQAALLLMNVLDKDKNNINKDNINDNNRTEEVKEFFKNTNGLKSFRLGISGPPGAGKSTFIEAFGLYLINLGFKVAVLPVDPSSQITGGSILGDKTRMIELSRNDNAYVRPSPSRGTLGGIAQNTMEAVILCEAAGYDIILIETVGVGQSEVAVAHISDMLMLLVPPVNGDELQGMKKGIVEMADLIVVNKADGVLKQLALRSKMEYLHAVMYFRHKSENWFPVVQTCSSIENDGSLKLVFDSIKDFKNKMSKSGELLQTRKAQRHKWMWTQLNEELFSALKNDTTIGGVIKEMEDKIDSNAITPRLAARKILSYFLEHNAFKENNIIEN